MSCDRFINIIAFQTFLYLPLLSWEICRGYLFLFLVARSQQAKRASSNPPHLAGGAPKNSPIPPLRCARFMKFHEISSTHEPIFRSLGLSTPLRKISTRFCLEWCCSKRIRVNISQWHLCLRRSLVFVVGQISFMDAKVIQSGCELLLFPRKNTHTPFRVYGKARQDFLRHNNHSP